VNLLSKLKATPAATLRQLAAEGLRCRLAAARRALLPLPREVRGRGSPEWRARADALFNAVGYAQAADVRGCVAEFGCFSGRTARFLAAGVAYFGGGQRLHLFDSFLGFPQASGPDLDLPFVKSGLWGAGRAMGLQTPASLRRKVRRFLPRGKVEVHAGWFKDTLPGFSEPVAVAHLDCDLWESTACVLGRLLGAGLLSPGGVLLFDDYNASRCDDSLGQRRAFREAACAYSVDADGRDYGVGGRAFVVSSYEPAGRAYL